MTERAIERDDWFARRDRETLPRSKPRHIAGFGTTWLACAALGTALASAIAAWSAIAQLQEFMREQRRPPASIERPIDCSSCHASATIPVRAMRKTAP